jgi:hypothetical protein
MTREVDPFDLPEWLGQSEVTWSPVGGVHDSHLVAGSLSAPGHEALPCDLLAVDEAYPKPVADDDLRHQTHQSWRHGQVLLLACDDRLTLAVPGTSFSAELVMETLARLAKAVGGSPESFSVLLRLGG